MHISEDWAVIAVIIIIGLALLIWGSVSTKVMEEEKISSKYTPIAYFSEQDKINDQLRTIFSSGTNGEKYHSCRLSADSSVLVVVYNAHSDWRGRFRMEYTKNEIINDLVMIKSFISPAIAKNGSETKLKQVFIVNDEGKTIGHINELDVATYFDLREGHNNGRERL